MQGTGIKLREEIVRRLAAELGGTEEILSKAELARRTRLDRATVRRHHTAAMKLVQTQREGPVTEEDLRRVDRMLTEKAKQGDMQAARLLFLRLKTLPEPEVTMPTVAELEEALLMLRKSGLA